MRSIVATRWGTIALNLPSANTCHRCCKDGCCGHPLSSFCPSVLLKAKQRGANRYETLLAEVHVLACSGC